MTGTLHATTSFHKAASASPHKLKKRRRSTSALYSPASGNNHKRRRDDALAGPASDDELPSSKQQRSDSVLARLLSNGDDGSGERGNAASGSLHGKSPAAEHGPRIREVLEKAQQLKWERYEDKAAAGRGNMAKYTALNEVKVNGAMPAGRPSYSYGDADASPVASSSKRKLDEPKQLWTPDVKTSWPSSMASVNRRAKGLHNLGNTCFANSILQIFVHTPAVLSCLETMAKSPKYPADMGAKRPPGMTSLLNDLRREVWSESSRGATTPQQIVHKIKQWCPSMRPGRQEDAHEFFRGAIDSMQDDALRVAGAEKAPHDVRETTWVHKVWGGKIRSRVLCTECKKPSDTYDTFLDLSLDVKRQQESWHLKDALAHFSRTETLQGKNGYKCENCKKIVRAEKSMKIVKAPPVLSLHLKRFGPMGGKIKTLVKYSHRLDLTPYTDGLAKEEYDLYGVTIHSGGGQHSGHYYSYVRGPGQGKWYEANDESVSPIDIRDPLNKTNAYVLHYIRRTAGGFEDILAGKPGPSSSSVPKSPRVNGSTVKPSTPAVVRPQTANESEAESEAERGDGEDVGQPVIPRASSPAAPSPRFNSLPSLAQSPRQTPLKVITPSQRPTTSLQRAGNGLGVVSANSFYGFGATKTPSSSTPTQLDFLQSTRAQNRNASWAPSSSSHHKTQAGRVTKPHGSPYHAGAKSRMNGREKMRTRDGMPSSGGNPANKGKKNQRKFTG